MEKIFFPWASPKYSLSCFNELAPFPPFSADRLLGDDVARAQLKHDTENVWRLTENVFVDLARLKHHFCDNIIGLSTFCFVKCKLCSLSPQNSISEAEIASQMWWTKKTNIEGGWCMQTGVKESSSDDVLNIFSSLIHRAERKRLDESSL